MDSVEERKIFVGGLAQETTDDSLHDFFSQYGEVESAKVMMDDKTGRSRGFGLVTFLDSSSVDAVILSKPHTLDGKAIDAKRCDVKGGKIKSGRNLRVFVGGIPSERTEEDIKDFMSQYGTVTDINLLKDPGKTRHRGFAYVGFEHEKTVQKLIGLRFLDFHGKKIEIKPMIKPNYENRSGGPAGFNKGGGPGGVMNTAMNNGYGMAQPGQMPYGGVGGPGQVWPGQQGSPWYGPGGAGPMQPFSGPQPYSGNAPMQPGQWGTGPYFPGQPGPMQVPGPQQWGTSNMQGGPMQPGQQWGAPGPMSQQWGPAQQQGAWGPPAAGGIPGQWSGQQTGGMPQGQWNDPSGGAAAWNGAPSGGMAPYGATPGPATWNQGPPGGSQPTQQWGGGPTQWSGNPTGQPNQWQPGAGGVASGPYGAAGGPGQYNAAGGAYNQPQMPNQGGGNWQNNSPTTNGNVRGGFQGGKGGSSAPGKVMSGGRGGGQSSSISGGASSGRSHPYRR